MTNKEVDVRPAVKGILNLIESSIGFIYENMEILSHIEERISVEVIDGLKEELGEFEHSIKILKEGLRLTKDE